MVHSVQIFSLAIINFKYFFFPGVFFFIGFIPDKINTMQTKKKFKIHVLDP